MMNNQCVVWCLSLVCMMLLLYCGEGNELSTDISSNVNKEEHSLHDPLKIGYPVDINKPEAVKHAEKIISLYMDQIISPNFQDLDRSAEMLLNQLTSEPGIEHLVIKNEKERKLYLEYNKNNLKIHHHLKEFKKQKLITNEEFETVYPVYAHFLGKYYNDTYDLEVPLRPQQY